MSLITKNDSLNEITTFIIDKSKSFTTKSYLNLFNEYNKEAIKEKIEKLEGYQQTLENILEDPRPLESEKARKVIAKMIWAGKKKLESPKIQLEKLLQYIAILIRKIDKNPDDENIDACLKDLFIACDGFSDFSKTAKKELEVFLFHCAFFKHNLKPSTNKDLIKVILSKLIGKGKKELKLRKKTPLPSCFKKQVFIFSGTDANKNGMKSISALQKKITEKGQSVTLIDIDTVDGRAKLLTLPIDDSTKYRVFTHGNVDQAAVITPFMLYTLFNYHAKSIKEQDVVLPISLVVCHSAEGGENSYARQLGKLLNDSGIHFRIKAYEGELRVHLGSGRKMANGQYDNHKFVFTNEQGKITAHRTRKLETLSTDTSASEDFFQLFSCNRPLS